MDMCACVYYSDILYIYIFIKWNKTLQSVLSIRLLDGTTTILKMNSTYNNQNNKDH